MRKKVINKYSVDQGETFKKLKATKASMRYEKIVASVVPTRTEEERIHRKVKAFVRTLERYTKHEHVIVGGSFAKGTWLHGKHDIDIFVTFPHDNDISHELEHILIKAFTKVTRIHGSRDYFQIKKYGLEFEVVPVFRIRDATEAHNVTDVSLLHVIWIKSHMTDYLKKEIRLLKLFCQANDLYGAETYIKGFSGYVLEIITTYYGSFLNVIKAAAKWEEEELINPAKTKMVLPKHKRSVLTIIDPVQPNRNVSAAVSQEKYYQFKKLAQTFLTRPSEDFFVKKPMTHKELKTYDIVLVVTPLEGKKDIIGTKILKVYELTRKSLDNADFGVSASGWFWKKKAYLYFNVHYQTLHETRKHYGPPRDKQMHLAQFQEKYEGRMIKEDEKGLYVILPREITDYKMFMKRLVKEKAITELVKKVKIMSFDDKG